MPVLEAEEVELIEADEATSVDLRLFESVLISEGSVQDDGTVILDLIRPCVGKGKGRHLYKADMLEANAGVFTGWKMYLNHLSDAARRALGGLPRDIRDTGGIVMESWWNPDVPASGRFGQGAVQGRVKPVPVVQELIRVDPRLVEASINATATACKAGKSGGERVWIVEGIESKGSVDWVTDGGAGGRVAQIMEAMIEDGSAVTGMMDDLDNGTLLAWLAEHRPELMEAIKKSDDEGDADDDEDDVEEQAKKLKAKNPKMSDAQATALAKSMVAKKAAVSETSQQEDDLPQITPEDLAEALASDEGKAALTSVLGPVLVEAIKELDLGSQVVSLVEAKLDDDRQVIRAEAEASADRRGDLRDLRDFAHKKIDESRLAPKLKTRMLARFTLVEGVPTTDLDVVSDEDENGKVVKSATEKLDEALTEAINEDMELMAALNPTRVRGQGVSKIVEGEESKGGDDKDKTDHVGPRTRSLLEAAGVKHPDKAWQGRFQLGGVQ